jgi:hypothetical protein
MVIARLYEGELDSTPPNLRRLLYDVSDNIHFLVIKDHNKVLCYQWNNFLWKIEGSKGLQ